MLELDAVPKKAKVCPLNPAQKKSLRDQLDVWIKEDIIEESQSPWVSALIPVRKWSQPNKTCWAMDYHALNNITIKDSYPLPNIQENLDKIQGIKIF